MLLLLKSKLQCFPLQLVDTHQHKRLCFFVYSTVPHSKPSLPNLQELCDQICSGIGSLDDLEASLDKLNISLTSSLVTQVVNSCKSEAPPRRLLRFFLWSCKNCELEDGDYNNAIRVFAEKKDFKAMDILMSDLAKQDRVLENQSFSKIANTYVKLGREDEALGIFKNLYEFRCSRDEDTVGAIVSALCLKGHAKRAEGVVWHHKDKISGVKPCIYRSLLYGWSVKENVKECRRILKEMKFAGVSPDIHCYNTFMWCLCKRNLKCNPSGLVPDASNLMAEMRIYGISPTSITYNILLTCLGKTRRVKESLRILNSMKKSGCSPDWASYYLVARVMYLTGRFGKGNEIVDEMFEEGLVPQPRFYHNLIGVLCGVERVNYALELFDRMKKNSVGGYGPVYDLVIPKLCRAGDFGKGRELWDEAIEMGITLNSCRDILDPSITEVSPDHELIYISELNHSIPGISVPLVLQNWIEGLDCMPQQKSEGQFYIYTRAQSNAKVCFTHLEATKPLRHLPVAMSMNPVE
ncbi:Pentatricopeptide repeat [Dillenia turbinata]|uniref:Pentatricopeptide repeat n=1 Tax=Dillenia turbinata TaxID=194707 RepID=A0AAN8Z3G7_9MAGN